MKIHSLACVSEISSQNGISVAYRNEYLTLELKEASEAIQRALYSTLIGSDTALENSIILFYQLNAQGVM